MSTGELQNESPAEQKQQPVGWDHKLTQGQFEGQTLGEVVGTHRGWYYLKYLQMHSDGELAESVDNVLEVYDTAPVLTLSAALDFIMPYGKHKHKTMREVSSSLDGIGYLSFILGQLPKTDEMVDYCTIVINNNTIQTSIDEAKQYVWPFGRYKSQTAESTMRHYQGRNWMQWMYRQLKTSSNYEMKCMLKLCLSLFDTEPIIEVQPEDRDAVVKFGRWKGQTLENISQSTRGLLWMKKMRKFLKTYQVEEYNFWITRAEEGL